MSRKKKFTPGPWEVKTFEGGLTDIMALHHSHWAIAEQVLQKDANLIAAAPELLEALESVSATLHDYIGDADQIDMAESAIKKAYGETE